MALERRVCDRIAASTRPRDSGGSYTRRSGTHRRHQPSQCSVGRRSSVPQISASVAADPDASRAQLVGMTCLHSDPSSPQHGNRREQHTMLDSVPAAILVILGWKRHLIRRLVRSTAVRLRNKALCQGLGHRPEQTDSAAPNRDAGCRLDPTRV